MPHRVSHCNKLFKQCMPSSVVRHHATECTSCCRRDGRHGDHLRSRDLRAVSGAGADDVGDVRVISYGAWRWGCADGCSRRGTGQGAPALPPPSATRWSAQWWLVGDEETRSGAGCRLRLGRRPVWQETHGGSPRHRRKIRTKRWRRGQQISVSTTDSGRLGTEHWTVLILQADGRQYDSNINDVTCSLHYGIHAFFSSKETNSNILNTSLENAPPLTCYITSTDMNRCWEFLADGMLINLDTGSVLFSNHPRSEGWPHHGRTFSILSLSSVIHPRGVLSTYWCRPINNSRISFSWDQCRCHCASKYFARG